MPSLPASRRVLRGGSLLEPPHQTPPDFDGAVMLAGPYGVDVLPGRFGDFLVADADHNRPEGAHGVRLGEEFTEFGGDVVHRELGFLRRDASDDGVGHTFPLLVGVV